MIRRLYDWCVPDKALQEKPKLWTGPVTMTWTRKPWS